MSCGGSGVIEGIKEVKVTIPPGWVYNASIKLPVTVPWLLINISDQSGINVDYYCGSYLFILEILYLKISTRPTFLYFLIEMGYPFVIIIKVSIDIVWNRIILNREVLLMLQQNYPAKIWLTICHTFFMLY